MGLGASRNDAASMMGVGIAIGAAVGVALDNLGLGIALGVVFGAAMSTRKRGSDEDEQDLNEQD